MVSRMTTERILKIAVPALVATFFVSSTLPAAARTGRVRAITKPKFDPAAKQVELFKGIKDGAITARLILKNSREGNVLIENKTDKPLTVKLPDAVVGVQVLKQGGMGMGMGMPGGGGGGGQQGGGGGGGGQSSGGGMGGSSMCAESWKSMLSSGLPGTTASASRMLWGVSRMRSALALVRLWQARQLARRNGRISLWKSTGLARLISATGNGPFLAASALDANRPVARIARVSFVSFILLCLILIF